MSEHAVFPPGTRIRFKRDERFIDPCPVFVVMQGGYYAEGDWCFHSTNRPFTRGEFEEVK